MPTAQISHVLRRLELRPAGEINGDHSADVSNRKARSADEFVVGEPRIEPGEEMLDARTPALGERRNLLVGLWAG